MKKIVLSSFFLFYFGHISAQELMNFYLEDNGIRNSITLHTKVYESHIIEFGGMEQQISGNTITVSLCYYYSIFYDFTFDMQSFTINLPNGNGNYTIDIRLYKDVEYPTCDYINLVDDGSINFDFPYYDTATTYMPDDNFEEYIETRYVGDGIPDNDLVLTSRIENIKRLFLTDPEPPLIPIQDATGIESFISLKYFWCYDNLITNLDVSNSVNLIHLYCNGNPLTQLNVTGNSNLESLRCSGPLLSLDLSNSINLKRLECNNTLLTQLDLTNNNLLEYVDCSNNNLIQLNLNNYNLKELRCHENNLNNIDFSNCNSLELVSCSENELVEIEISNLNSLKTLACDKNQLVEIDLTQNTQLEEFSCIFSDLTYVNIQNGNNEIITTFATLFSYDLDCIQVDDEEAAYIQNWYVDSWTEISEDCTIGIDEIIIDDTIDLYPNPVSQKLFIKNNNTHIQSLVIYDTLGNIVLEEYIHFQEIDIQILKTGFYLVKIATDKGTIIKKVLKI